jgi:flagellar basal body-associated protein FliL
MIKEKNEETGEVKVIFSSEEFKKLKIFGGAAVVLLVLSAGLAGWAAYSTTALHAENELYRGQLKMADEKMQALESIINKIYPYFYHTEKITCNKFTGFQFRK